MAYVPQEGFTMSATLRENVCIEYLSESGSTVDDRRVLEALRLAQFDPASERVQEGLEAEIGERGVNLSGGQRQRISLARARYAERPIILLDDCLSAVDVDTERHLVDQLIAGAWAGRARVLATHRLSVLPLCDRVLFLEDGAITLQGTYDQLLERSEVFRDFVRREAVRKKEATQPVQEPQLAQATVAASQASGASPAADGEEPI
jgi:ABC-type multidrug transport system fused ATPase/permease subunit